MKKFFGILFTLVLLTAAPASAQFDFGFKAGVNLPESPSNISDVTKSRTGWFVGPTAKFVVPIIGLGAEVNLLYSENSNKIDGETVTRKSFELPVYLRYEFSLPLVNKFLEPFLAVGPQWSWNVGGKISENQHSHSAPMGGYGRINMAQGSTITVDSNFSVNFGLGAIVLDHIQIHANYNLALGSTADYTSVSAGTKNLITKSKTNTWQFSVAYIF